MRYSAIFSALSRYCLHFARIFSFTFSLSVSSENFKVTLRSRLRFQNHLIHIPGRLVPSYGSLVGRKCLNGTYSWLILKNRLEHADIMKVLLDNFFVCLHSQLVEPVATLFQDCLLFYLYLTELIIKWGLCLIDYEEP